MKDAETRISLIIIYENVELRRRKMEEGNERNADRISLGKVKDE